MYILTMIYDSLSLSLSLSFGYLNNMYLFNSEVNKNSPFWYFGNDKKREREREVAGGGGVNHYSLSLYGENSNQATSL